MKIVVSRNELLAALLFASTDESRYVLSGANIEVAKDKKPVIIATDGRRLVAISTTAEQRDLHEEYFNITLRPDFLHPLCQLNKAIGGKLFPWICFEFKEGSPVLTVDFIGGHMEMTVDDGWKIEGQYPDWRRVLPSKSKSKREQINDIGMNSAFIGDFAKAAKLLESKSTQVQMSLVGKEQQVEIKLHGVENFYGLFMPCKIDDDMEYQPEFVSVVKHAETQNPKPEEKDGQEKESTDAEANKA